MQCHHLLTNLKKRIKIIDFYLLHFENLKMCMSRQEGNKNISYTISYTLRKSKHMTQHIIPRKSFIKFNPTSSTTDNFNHSHTLLIILEMEQHARVRVIDSINKYVCAGKCGFRTFNLIPHVSCVHIIHYKCDDFALDIALDAVQNIYFSPSYCIYPSIHT